MTVTYYGHSAFQIETSGPTLLFDPFITGNKHTEGVVTAEDLAPDVVLITHAHGDHWGDTPSILERTGALLVAQFDVTQYAQRVLDYTNVHPMNTGGAWDFEWGRVTNTYARHSSSFPDGAYGGLAGGFILEIDGTTIYNAGDTCRFAEMAWLGEQYDFDLCFLPIGDDFTMGIDEAVESAKMLRPKLTVPVHYDTFPLIMADTAEFASKMEAAGLKAQPLTPGESLVV
ncbi:MAG: metal-dependent hydrolase [Bacteroidota bacterium]